MSLVDYLANVKDKETFIEFVNAMIEERSSAENLERTDPGSFKNKGAFGWENTSIESYLQAALVWLVDSDRNEASWKLMAEFLYSGKVYE